MCRYLALEHFRGKTGERAEKGGAGRKLGRERLHVLANFIERELVMLVKVQILR